MTKRVARPTTTDAPALQALASRLAELRSELWGRGHVEAAGVLSAVEACLGREHERETLAALEALAARKESERLRLATKQVLAELKTSDVVEHDRLASMLSPGWDRRRRGAPKRPIASLHPALVRLVTDLRAKGEEDPRIADNLLSSIVNVLWPTVPAERRERVDLTTIVHRDAVAFVNAAFRALDLDPQRATGAKRQESSRAARKRLAAKRPQ